MQGLHTFDQETDVDALLDQYNPDGALASVIAASKPWTWLDGPDKGKTPRIYHVSAHI